MLDGIQKRLDRLLDPSEVRRGLRLAVAAARPCHIPLPELEAQLRETPRKIGRLVDALAAGPEDLQPARSALVRLDAERHRRERELDDARHQDSGGDQSPDAVLDGLVASLGNVHEALASGAPEERKAVVRGFLQGIRSSAHRGGRSSGGTGSRRIGLLSWWRWEELNLRHGAYETPALPLSYTAKCREIRGLRTGILSHRGRVCPKICPRRSPHAGRPPGVALFRDVGAVESAARPVAGDGHRRVLGAFRPEPCCRCPSSAGRRRDVRERRRQSEARMRPT